MNDLKISLRGIWIIIKNVIGETIFYNTNVKICTLAMILLFFIIFHSNYNSSMMNEFYTSPGDVFIQLLNININPLLYCGIMIFSLVILCERPNISQTAQFYISRCGKMAWILGEMGGIFISGIITAIFLWVVGILVNIYTINWSYLFPTLRSCIAFLAFTLFFLAIGNILMLCKILHLQSYGIAVIGIILAADRGIADLIPNTLFAMGEKNYDKILSWYNQLSPANRLSNIVTEVNQKSTLLYFLSMVIISGICLIITSQKKDI